MRAHRLAAVLGALAGASCTAALETGPAAGPGTLEVNLGYGGGTYNAGDVVHVWAAHDPLAEIVTSWTGDVGGLDAPGEWNGTYTMPGRDAYLAPTITAVPLALTTQTASLPGGTRDYSLVEPADPVGVVIFFHGASYNRTELEDIAAWGVTMRLVHAAMSSSSVRL